MNVAVKRNPIKYYFLKDDGQFPNSKYPVLLYKDILKLPFFRPSAYVEKIFKKNNWTNSWRGGIYEFNHYHSNTHEVMGVIKGKTTLLLGGMKGIKVNIKKGDVLVVPAGVAHQNLHVENKVKCVGAYPNGIEYDIKYGKPEERPQADRNIKKVSEGKIADPIFGRLMGTPEYWKSLS